MDGTWMMLAQAVVAFLGGLVAGALLFGSLWWNVRLLVGGGSPFRAIVFQLVRLAGAGAILYAAVRFGALPLLAAALGLLVARAVAVRLVEAGPE